MSCRARRGARALLAFVGCCLSPTFQLLIFCSEYLRIDKRMPRTSTTLRSATSALEISFTVQVWKENSTYVGYVPELDVSSCGDSIRQVKTRLREAVGLFLEEASRLGTLEDILSEAGFVKHGNAYRAHRVLVREKVRLAVPLSPAV